MNNDTVMKIAQEVWGAPVADCAKDNVIEYVRRLREAWEAELMQQEPLSTRNSLLAIANGQPLYPASALKAAKVKVLREAAEKFNGEYHDTVTRKELLSMADELEKK